MTSFSLKPSQSHFVLRSKNFHLANRIILSPLLFGHPLPCGPKNNVLVQPNKQINQPHVRYSEVARIEHAIRPRIIAQLIQSVESRLFHAHDPRG